MLNPVCNELLMREAYMAQLREAEKNRLAGQARVGQRRERRLLSSSRAWLGRQLLMLRPEWLIYLEDAAEKAPAGSGMRSSLIL